MKLYICTSMYLVVEKCVKGIYIHVHSKCKCSKTHNDLVPCFQPAHDSFPVWIQFTNNYMEARLLALLGHPCLIKLRSMCFVMVVVLSLGSRPSPCAHYIAHAEEGDKRGRPRLIDHVGRHGVDACRRGLATGMQLHCKSSTSCTYIY